MCVCACEINSCTFCCCSVGPFEVCDSTNVTGSKFSSLWGWVPMASYMGSGNFELENGTVTVDTWGLSSSVSI